MSPSRTLAALAATAAALAGVAGVAGADPLGDQFQISQQGPDGATSYDTFGAAIAFNPVRKEHLVVWVGTTTANPEVFAQRITQTGARIDAPVQLSTDGNESTGDPASVAYDPNLDRYLVTWEAGSQVRARRVGGDGTALGASDTVVSDPAGGGDDYSDIETTQPVYDPKKQRFLLVWKAQKGPDNQQAFAQIVAADGDLTGPDSQITNLATEVDDAIDVAHNGTTGEFAVAFHSDDVPPGNRTEIFIQRLDADAQRIGIETQISEGGVGGYQQPPRIAWNSKRNEWLVAWAGEAPSYGTNGEVEIRIQRLSSTGEQIGANDARVTSFGPDGSTDYQPSRPDIAYHPEVDEYLLVFHADDDTPPLIDDANEVFGQRLSGTGDEIGTDDFRISETLPDDETSARAQRPRVAYDSDVCDYMVAWHTTAAATSPPVESEIHGRRVEGPLCAPRPTAPPTLSGTAREGDALACTPGAYRFADTTAIQWLRDGQPVPGATGSSYTPTANDVGRDIACRSTGSNPTGSASQTTGSVKPVAKPAPSAQRVAVKALKRKVSKRDRSLPFRYTTKGRIVLPEGVRAADGCAGKVSVQIKRGRKTVSNRRAKVKPNCTFRSKVKFTLRNRLGDKGKLKFTVRFLGNKVLLPKKAKPLKRRFG